MSRLSNASNSESAVAVPLPFSPDWQQVIRAEMWASTDRQYRQQLRELLGPLSTTERVMELCRFVSVEILIWSCVVIGGAVSGTVIGTFYTFYLLLVAIPVTVVMFLFLAKWTAVIVVLGLIGMSLILGIDYGKKILGTLQDYRDRCRRETAWRKRAFFMDPLPDATLAGIGAACAAHPERSAAFQSAMADIAANQDESSALVHELDSADWRRRFITRQVLFARGAAAIRDLELASRSSNESHRATVKALIRAIALASQRQMARLKHRHLCPEHLMRCRRYRLHLGDGSMVTYCGCRHDGCRASVGAYSCPGGAVLVLDREWKESLVHDGNRLLINAATFREMCDVERVEIRSASDSDVRSLLIRLANDTDTRRWSWFSPLRCYLSSRCTLSEQTRRALSGSLRAYPFDFELTLRTDERHLRLVGRQILRLSQRERSMSGLKDSDYEFSEQQQQSLRLARQQEGLVRELQGIREQVHVAARGLSPGLRSSFPREVKTAEQWQLQVGAMEIAGGELAGNIDLLARHVSQGRATLTSLVAIASEHAPQLSRELGSRLAIFEATVTGQLHLLSQWHPPKKTTNHRQFIAIAHDQLARQEFTALGVQLTLQEKQLSEELEQADRQEEKQQKRLKLLAALRDVCRDLGFLELGAPEYESREERGSRIMFAVDTINRGIIHFALSLDSIQSESAIADNHCFDEFDQLSRDLEEKFSIRTKFRPADEQRPLGSRRGARELPGGAGQARQARA